MTSFEFVLLFLLVLSLFAAYLMRSVLYDYKAEAELYKQNAKFWEHQADLYRGCWCETLKDLTALKKERAK